MGLPVNRYQRCVLCGNPVTVPVFPEIEEVEYGTGWAGSAFSCEKCGLIHQVPLPDEKESLLQYPNSYIHYNPYVTGLKGMLMKFYMKRTVRLLSDLGARPGDRLLDIGCGAGEKLAILKNILKLDVTGLEPNVQAARKAEAMFGLNVVPDFFNRGYFEPESFDFIRINHVIEHVPDPIGLLNETFCLLKPGGWLIGETENFDCLSYRIFGRYWALLHFPYHLLIFDKHTIEIAFKASRFKEVSISDIYDPTAWSLSVQNFIYKGKPLSKRSGNRMPGYTIMTVFCYPLTLLERACGKGAVIEFKARKRPHENLL